ncbi:MAG: contractile injection system tape measure protein, partial [Bacteroidota bacterium]
MVPTALASGQVGSARQQQLDALDTLIKEAADLAATEAEQEAFEDLMARVNVRELVDALFSLRLQLDQQRSGWSGAEWLERLVRRLARKYRVRYAVMLRAIRKAMEKTVDLQRLLTLEPELQHCLDLLAESHPLQQPITAYGEVARLDVLEFFLRYGALPWWAAAATGPDRMPETLRVLTASVPHEVKAMLERSGNRLEVRERLIQQFPETQLPEVLAVFPIAGQPTFLLGIQALLLLPTSTFRLPVSRSVWRYQVWEHALKLLVANPGVARPDGSTLLEKLLEALALRIKLPVRDLYSALETVQTALPEAGKAELFRQLRQRGNRWRPMSKSPGEREKEPPVREAHQELQEAEAAMRQAADQPSGHAIAGQRSELFVLKHYLAQGRFPDWAGEYPFHSVGE